MSNPQIVTAYDPETGKEVPAMLDPVTNRVVRVRYIRDPRQGGRLVAVPQRDALVSTVDPGFGGRFPTENMNDLLSRLPDADIAGAIGPGVVPGGDQGGMANRAALLRADGGVVTIPTQRPLQGAQSNNRGNAVIFELGGSAGTTEIKPVIEVPKSSGEDAETITVCLGREIVNQSAGFPSASADPAYTAILEWGTGNAFFTAEIDWEYGKIIVIPGSWLRVRARGTLLTSGGVPAPIEKLSAAFSYGNISHPKANGAKLTHHLAFGPNGGGGTFAQTFDVPNFATHVGVIGWAVVGGLSPVNPNLAVRFVHTFGIGVNAYYQAVYTNSSNGASQVEDTYMIPNSIKTIQVENLDNTNNFAGALVFSLAL